MHSNKSILVPVSVPIAMLGLFCLKDKFPSLKIKAALYGSKVHRCKLYHGLVTICCSFFNKIYCYVYIGNFKILSLYKFLDETARCYCMPRTNIG